METVVREAQSIASQLIVQGKSPGRTRTEAWQKLLSSASNLGRLAKLNSVSKLHQMDQTLKGLHLLSRGHGWLQSHVLNWMSFSGPSLQAQGRTGGQASPVGCSPSEISVGSEVTDIQQSNIHDVHLLSTHFEVHLVKSQCRS